MQICRYVGRIADLKKKKHGRTSIFGKHKAIVVHDNIIFLSKISFIENFSYLCAKSHKTRGAMKRLVTIMVLLLMAVGMQAQKQISYIKADGAWYQVYDESGKKITTLSKQTVGTVMGWGTDFIVTVDGAWVKTYDITGKKICTLSKQTVGEVISASGNTFTCRDGSWIKIYDKNGKKINTLPAT